MQNSPNTPPLQKKASKITLPDGDDWSKNAPQLKQRQKKTNSVQRLSLTNSNRKDTFFPLKKNMSTSNISNLSSTPPTLPNLDTSMSMMDININNANNTDPRVSHTANTPTMRGKFNKVNKEIAVKTRTAAANDYRGKLMSKYPPPNGKKHLVKGQQAYESIPVGGAETSSSGIHDSRRRPHIPPTVEQSVKGKETMKRMNDYFCSQTAKYDEQIKDHLKRHMKKFQEMKMQGKTNNKVMSVFDHTRKLYNALNKVGTANIFRAHAMLTNPKRKNPIQSFKYLLFIDKVRNAMSDWLKLLEIIVKPWQCWMHCFRFDEHNAKELQLFGNILLTNFNRSGRMYRPFPQWLIDLKGWEDSIAFKYKSRPTYRAQVVEHIKDGQYWARYHPFIQEENDDVYRAKWEAGTDTWPSSLALDRYWFSFSDVNHRKEFMSLDEYHSMAPKGDSAFDFQDIPMVSSTNLISDDSLTSNITHIPHNIQSQMSTIQEQKIEEMSLDKPFNSDIELSDTPDSPIISSDDDIYTGVNDEYLRPIQPSIYRCPLPKQDDFLGWKPYQRHFYQLLNRDLLDISPMERQIINNDYYDFWRRRSMAMGKHIDFPICSYRLLLKKLNAEYNVDQNLRLIAILKEHKISTINAPLTISKYMPKWLQTMVTKHMYRLMISLKKQRTDYKIEKVELLNTLKTEIKQRKIYNDKLRLYSNKKKLILNDQTLKLKDIHRRQMSLLDFLVTAKHRVINAKLKVKYAREQVINLEEDVKDLREMTPVEQHFAKKHQQYFEDVSIKKLCKQYKSLKLKNYEPNEKYIKQYIERTIKRIQDVSVYQFWWWALLHREINHPKKIIFYTAFDFINPNKGWQIPKNELPTVLAQIETDNALICKYLPRQERKKEILNLFEERRMQSTILSERNEDENDDDDDVSSGMNINECESERFQKLFAPGANKYMSDAERARDFRRAKTMHGLQIAEDNYRQQHPITKAEQSEKLVFCEELKKMLHNINLANEMVGDADAVKVGNQSRRNSLLLRQMKILRDPTTDFKSIAMQSRSRIQSMADLLTMGVEDEDDEYYSSEIETESSSDDDDEDDVYDDDDGEYSELDTDESESVTMSDDYESESESESGSEESESVSESVSNYYGSEESSVAEYTSDDNESVDQRIDIGFSEQIRKNLLMSAASGTGKSIV